MSRRTDRVYDPLGLPHGRTSPSDGDVCPRCGGLLAEDEVLDPPRGFASVPMCMDDEGCGWRLWRRPEGYQPQANRPAVQPERRTAAVKETRVSTFDDNGMDYRDFLRIRNAGRSKWAQVLIQADLQPMVPAACPRCNGRIMRATDEHGAPDAHCVACGYRPADVLDPERAAAIMRERDGYDDSGRKRRRALQGPRLRGGSR